MELQKKINEKIKALKKNMHWFCIGKSQLEKDIICFEIGNCCGKTVIIQGGIHAREYITSFFLLDLLKYLQNFVFNGKIYVIPISNPDGVDIAINGLKNIKSPEKRKFLKSLVNDRNFKKFKANANGVDLNTNFDAFWGQGDQNVFEPAYANFVGNKPNSEKEVVNLINFTKKIKPDLTLSYHSKGEEIYYGFKNQIKNELQTKYLDILKKETGYKPIYLKNSCGGYRDYCILKLDIIGFTIEVGSDKLSHPLPMSEQKKIFTKNKDLVLQLLKV